MTRRPVEWWGAAVLPVLLAFASPVAATTLQVGPDAPFKGPGAAARAAQDGDTIEIAPGEYYDCAVWYANRLTIAGPADPATPAVLTDTTCQGKAIFVIAGQDVTVRNLTFARARVPDGNGAGIRMEGRNLTVANSRFINNQAGILAGDIGDATLSVIDSVFEGNGACNERRCEGTIIAGTLLRLRIERSRFTANRGGALVRGGAQRTDILASRFVVGPAGISAPMVTLSGGATLIADNQFERTADSGAPDTVIAVRDLWGPVAGLVLQRNTLANGTGRPLVFLHNLSASTPRLDANLISQGDTPLDESGYWTGRARDVARGVRDDAKAIAGLAKRAIMKLWPF